MPVRVYEIAKEIGIPSKVVLSKLKEYKIPGVRTASSSVDKITAEYILEKLRVEFPPPEPPAEPAESESAAETPVTAETASPTAEAPPAAEPPAEPPVETAPAEAATQAPPEAASTAEPTTETPPSPPAEPAPAAAEEPPAPADAATAEAGAETKPEAEKPAEAADAEPRAAEEEAIEEEKEEEELEEPAKPRTGALVGRIDISKFLVKPRETARESRKARKKDKEKDRDKKKAAASGPAAAPARTSAGAPPRGGRQLPPLPPPETLTAGEIVMKPPIIIRELAARLNRKPHQIIADLIEMGVFATVNQSIEAEVAQRVCAKYKMRFRVEKREKGGALVKERPKKVELLDAEDRPEDMKPRPPVITIMGHVDHGKTTLLDAIRNSNVVETEAGRITQHIGAYTIHFPHPERKNELQKITFIDTPGHAAFSAMRARGANVTDIVILVVAAEEGVKPQTLEALDHARAAGVPIIVAVNKCDHPAANPLRVRQQLQERGLVPDEWGGDTIFVDISALTKQGVDKLLEMILLQAELMELKANPNRPAKGNVIESGIEPGGPTATVLVRKGTLHTGDVMVCGPYYGRVRALIDDRGQRLKEAGPSDAVKVLGLNGVPEAGAEFGVVKNEREARELCEERAEEMRRAQQARRRTPTSLRDILDQLSGESAKVLRVFIKADTQGSVEAITDALKQIKSDKVSLDIVSSGVGNISETDVLLASASKAIILGFHSKVDHAAAEAAKREGVEIRLYAIIYELIDEVRRVMAGLLEPKREEITTGVAEVRKIFELSKGGHVAGCAVTSGRIIRGKARVIRRKNRIYEGLVSTLRRFQDDVNEVRAGMECGIRLEGFDDFREGDLIETYEVREVPQEL
ncbi:MAG: translation initiation factor IF-2 [Verrucomicrobia bacterium]|nr:MAG: translation initiation factor IF-2 [Verrucomicrobiota bacterium]